MSPDLLMQEAIAIARKASATGDVPVGHLEILADLGVNSMELSALCDDAELFPDEQLEAIASRLGFADQFAELLEL